MKNFFFNAFVYAFLCSALFISCSEDDAAPKPSITEIAASNPDFSTLVTALQLTDLDGVLDGTGTFTVFAPTNAAFDAFLSANNFSSINAVPTAVLREVLLNHVLATEEFSGDLATTYVSTLATGSASTNKISMFIEVNNGVKINGGTSNGGAMVTTADIDACNGVIHVVDGVIGLPTIVNHAVANANFSSLVAALTQADLVAPFASPTSKNTVFAPTNEAFTNVLTELNVASLSAIPTADLTNVLTYHVVGNANVLSTDLTNNAQVTTLNGGSFTVQLPTSGPQILDAQNRTCNIVATDVQATNGVIHVVSKVLRP